MRVREMGVARGWHYRTLWREERGAGVSDWRQGSCTPIMRTQDGQLLRRAALGVRTPEPGSRQGPCVAERGEARTDEVSASALRARNPMSVGEREGVGDVLLALPQ